MNILNGSPNCSLTLCYDELWLSTFFLLAMVNYQQDKTHRTATIFACNSASKNKWVQNYLLYISVVSYYLKKRELWRFLLIVKDWKLWNTSVFYYGCSWPLLLLKTELKTKTVVEWVDIMTNKYFTAYHDFYLNFQFVLFWFLWLDYRNFSFVQLDNYLNTIFIWKNWW